MIVIFLGDMDEEIVRKAANFTHSDSKNTIKAYAEITRD